MKSKIVPVKNIAAMSMSSKALLNRAPRAPGIGLIDGDAGFGKTQGSFWLACQTKSIFVRCKRVHTPGEMLRDMCTELVIPQGGSNSQRVDRIVQAVSLRKLSVFVDDIDNVVKNIDLIETLRDIHDLSEQPLIIIGETGIEQKLAHLSRFTSRIAEHVTFRPLDADDTALVARELCEVTVATDLVEKIRADTAGNFRNIIVSLHRAEQIALGKGSDTVTVADVGRKPLFTGGALAQAV